MSDYERRRLRALQQLNLLDTPPSESFDRITRMAAQLFDLPVGAVSLTDEDRQWFKSRVGTELWEVPRNKSPCSEVSAISEVLVIDDMLASDCYRDSPQARLGMRFYAGAPLRTRDDYILGTLCVLGPSPRLATSDEIRGLQDLSAMVMAQIELQHALGRVDPITGLPNRSQFSDDLADLARDSPRDSYFALLIELLDVVQINTLNRVMGVDQVDKLAREGHAVLDSQRAPEDRLYSVGPCQYLLLRKAQDESGVKQEAMRLSRALQNLNQQETLPALVHPAIGLASFHPDQTTPADILRITHSACQDARQHETLIKRYSRSLDADHQRRYTLIRDMKRALDSSDELHLVFQPRVDLKTGQCVGAEALLRWRHPELGEVPPSEFIPLIENTPLARGLTAWVIRNATQQAAAWYRQGFSLRVSANIMASNLEEEGFAQQLLTQMKLVNLPVNAFELELTESTLASNSRSVHRQLGTLVSEGIRIAIDDFGTGYSSLSYLLKLPADVVKIDRAFTTRQRGQRRREALLGSLISLAHGLGYKTVAEGFAPMDMLDTLRRLGCDEVQSFAITRPLPVNTFETWLADFSLNGCHLQKPGLSAFPVLK